MKDQPERPYTFTAAELDKICGQSNPLTEIANKLAMKLAQQRDQILRDAITRRVGNDTWTLEEIVPRMKALRYENDPTQATTYTLDGEPLVIIWPPKNDSWPTPPGENWHHVPLEAHTMPTTLRYSIAYKTFEP